MAKKKSKELHRLLGDVNLNQQVLRLCQYQEEILDKALRHYLVKLAKDVKNKVYRDPQEEGGFYNPNEEINYIMPLIEYMFNSTNYLEFGRDCGFSSYGDEKLEELGFTKVGSRDNDLPF